VQAFLLENQKSAGNPVCPCPKTVCKLGGVTCQCGRVTSLCAGVEYNSASGRCELWKTAPAKTGGSSAYSCYVRRSPTSTPTPRPTPAPTRTPTPARQPTPPGKVDDGDHPMLNDKAKKSGRKKGGSGGAIVMGVVIIVIVLVTTTLLQKKKERIGFDDSQSAPQVLDDSQFSIAQGERAAAHPESPMAGNDLA